MKAQAAGKTAKGENTDSIASTPHNCDPTMIQAKGKSIGDRLSRTV
jgi:hypothetical protein